MRLDITISIIEKWAVFLIVFIAYYILSSNLIINTYHLTHLPPTNEIRCGMPLLACLMGQIILTGIASTLLLIIIVIKKKFTKSTYWLSTLAIILPLVIVICLVFL